MKTKYVCFHDNRVKVNSNFKYKSLQVGGKEKEQQNQLYVVILLRIFAS